MTKISLILAAILILSGCTSIYSRPDRVQDRCKPGYPVLYPGVRNDINNIGQTAAVTLGLKKNESKGTPYIIYPLSIIFFTIDIPFSFLMDTAVIGYDIDQIDICKKYRASISKNENEQKP